MAVVSRRQARSQKVGHETTGDELVVVVVVVVVVVEQRGSTPHIITIMFTSVLRSSASKAPHALPLRKVRGSISITPSQQPSSDIVRWFGVQVDSDPDDEPVSEGVITNNSNTRNIPLKTSTTRSKDFNDLPINYADISRAEVAIRGGVKRTTCEKSHFISELVGANVYLKNEFRQFTGSFKERGARNAILQLMREHGTSLRGVIAASAGNHALALAYHGKELGIPVTVVMPTVAPMAKVDKCRVSCAYVLP